MSTEGDVHVADIGTHYKGEIQDAGEAFDPSTADEAKIVFKTRSSTNGGIVVRDATITTEGSGSDQKWFLNYNVVAADIADGLHEKKGTYSWQGFVHFPDGQQYHTNIEEYEVEKNLLDAP